MKKVLLLCISIITACSSLETKHKVAFDQEHQHYMQAQILIKQNCRPIVLSCVEQILGKEWVQNAVFPDMASRALEMMHNIMTNVTISADERKSRLVLLETAYVAAIKTQSQQLIRMDDSQRQQFFQSVILAGILSRNN